MMLLMTLNQHVNNFIIANLKNETMGKLNTKFVLFDIKFTRLALKTHVEMLDKPRNANKRSQSIVW